MECLTSNTLAFVIGYSVASLSFIGIIALVERVIKK